MMPSTKLWRGPKPAFAFVACLLLIAVAAFGPGRVIQADDLQAQAIFNIDLAATPANVSIIGANAADHLSGNGTQNSFLTIPRAHAIATGDFNNDGIQDIVIGAPDADFTTQGGTTRLNAGAVYVVFGKSPFVNGQVIDANLQSAGTQPEIKIFGAFAQDNLGFAVAAGDVNGDNIDDLLIGAPGFDFPFATQPSVERPDSGAVYVIYGSGTLGPSIIDLSLANAARVAIFGERAGDLFGSSIAVGEVNGNTSPADALIGAPGSSGPDPAANPRVNAGAAFLLFNLVNAAATTRTIDLVSTAANVTIYGKAGSKLGSSVAIGDVNAGGSRDLILGAPNANRPDTPSEILETGAAFVIFGGTNLNPPQGAAIRVFDINAVEQQISIYGATTLDHLGAHVAAGDVTGDGTSDLLIGAPDADGLNDSRAEAGEAYVIAGSTDLNPPSPPPPGGSPDLRITASLQNVTLTVIGSQLAEHLGSTVAAGVVNLSGNADLLPDFLIGAPGFDGNGKTNSGAVSIIFGGANLTRLPALDTALNQDNVRVIGQDAADELGWAIDAADVDNNRGGDLIIGAPFNDPAVGQVARPDAGKVYVLLAANDVVPPVNQNPVVEVTSPNGGNDVQGGTVFNITWTASDANGNDTIQRFEIRLSTDGGTNFNTIIAPPPAIPGSARSFAWNVPIGINTTTARIRVIAFDNAGGQGQDDSNANFTIRDAGVLVRLLAPNGRETLRFGQVFRIEWFVPAELASQLRGFNLFLQIGTTITAISNNPLEPAIGPGVRTFDWTVPATCTNNARILIEAVSLTGASSFDASDEPFTIAAPGPTIDVTEMDLNGSATKLNLEVTTINGSEVRFAQGVTIEVSSDEAGTTFFNLARAKVKSSGRRLQGKGQINGQTLGQFFPEGATRVLRVTNPPCGTTTLRVRRLMGALVLVTTANASRTVWP